MCSGKYSTGNIVVHKDDDDWSAAQQMIDQGVYLNESQRHLLT